MGIEAGVAGKPSSPQDGNGGGMKSRGGGGSGDRRMAWVSLEKAFEGGGASVRGVPRERKESEGGGGGGEGGGGSQFNVVGWLYQRWQHARAAEAGWRTRVSGGAGRRGTCG
jgi:hypothetical protein